MPLMTTEQAIRDIKDGKMVILVDDEDRENEGDLCMAADRVTPQAINFMATYGRGLICLAMTAEKCDALICPRWSTIIPHLLGQVSRCLSKPAAG